VSKDEGKAQPACVSDLAWTFAIRCWNVQIAIQHG